MLVDEWVVTLWSILNVRDKTIRDYKHLYKRHLQPVIGPTEIDLVASRDIQVKLLSLPPQTARHTLMVAKTIWREAENYGVATSNPLMKIKTAPIQVTTKKFLTWDEVNSLQWGKYNNQIRFLALHGLRWSEAAVKGDVPVGALVVDDAGTIVGMGANLREQDNDPTAHAEIVAIRNAAKKLGNYRLDDLTMVVTLEPCGMCAGAIAQSRIKRLVFGSFDEKAGAVGSVWDLLRDPRALHKLEVLSGILKQV